MGDGMSAPYRTVYETRDGRVALLALHKVYSVRIAGVVYGPFSWGDALAWYRRHKGARP